MDFDFVLEVAPVGRGEEAEFVGLGIDLKGPEQDSSAHHHGQSQLSSLRALLLEANHFFEQLHLAHSVDQYLIVRVALV